MKMEANRRLVGLSVAAGMLIPIVGCPPVGLVGFTIASQAFVFALQETGVIDVLANAANPARKAGVVSLPFDAPPTDQPGSATLRVGTVRALPLEDTSKPAAQSLNGKATIVVRCAAADATDPCADGVLVGSFDVVITDGSVRLVNGGLRVPAAALPFVRSGTFTICFEVTATIDVKITIDEMTCDFGSVESTAPSSPDLVDETNTNDNGSPTDNANGNGADNGNQNGSGNGNDNGGDGGFIPALIEHRGSEQILAGAEIDEQFGLVTRDDFTVGPQVFDTFNRSYALNGNGTYVWFRLLAPFAVDGQDRTQIWCINTDGTGGLRSIVPADRRTTFGLHVETNVDGAVAVFNFGGSFYRASPGEPLETLFSYTGNFDFRSLFKVNDPGDRFYVVDSRSSHRGVYTVDLTTIPFNPSALVVAADIPVIAVNPRNFGAEFDAAGDFPAYLFEPNYDVSATPTERLRDIFYFGSGLVTRQVDTIFEETRVLNESRPDQSVFDLNISDDGQTFAYCRNVDGNTGINPIVPCFVETVDGEVTQVGDGRTQPGNFKMSDNGARVFYTTDRCCEGKTPILQDVGTENRVAAGTPIFAPNWSRHVQIDDVGRTLVTHCAAGGSNGGLYVLHDGNSIRSGFPRIDGISYRYEDDCRLTVRVRASSARGVREVRIYPYFDGVNPTQAVPGPENPFFSDRIRNGGAEMQPVADTANVWEWDFPLTNSEGACVQQLITVDYRLRIVVVDANDTLTVFEEFSPAR